MRIIIEEYTNRYHDTMPKVLGKTRRSDILEYTTIVRLRGCVVRVVEFGFKNPQHETNQAEFIKAIEEKIVNTKSLLKKVRELNITNWQNIVLPVEEPKKKDDAKTEQDAPEKKDDKQDEPEVVVGEVVDEAKKDDKKKDDKKKK